MMFKHNAYEGQRCFILGTGPSLLWNDLSPLKDEITIGVNGLFKYDRLPFTPSYFCFIDHKAWPDFHEDIERLDTTLVCALREDWPTETPGWIRLLQRRDRPLSEGWFGGLESEFEWVAGRANVVWSLCVQMAYWLGFSEVYLLGCDGGPAVHCYDDLYGILMGDKEAPPENHKTVAATQKSIGRVRRVYEDAGRKLVNLNPRTKITGLPTSTLKEVLSESPAYGKQRVDREAPPAVAGSPRRRSAAVR